VRAAASPLNVTTSSVGCQHNIEAADAGADLAAMNHRGNAQCSSSSSSKALS